MRRGDRAGRGLDPEPGRPHQRDRASQEPDQGRRLALPLRADEAAADGLPGRRRGLAMATRRRTPTPRPSRDARRRSGSGRSVPFAGRQPRTSPARSSGRPARPRRGDAHRADPPGRGRADRLVDRDPSARGSAASAGCCRSCCWAPAGTSSGVPAGSPARVGARRCSAPRSPTSR